VVVRLDREAVLLLRTRARRYELPKGHVELGETDEAAALRELFEETAIEASLEPRGLLATIHYAFPGAGGTVTKAVAFHLFVCATARLGALPPRIRERRWCRRAEVADIPLRSENLRPLLAQAFRVAGAETK